MQGVMVAALAFVAGADWRWEQLPPLPDREGFAGAFAGVSGGSLIVAAGANFPGKKPWEGGAKVWYDSVFALDKPNGKWVIAGKLPRPLGYGVSVTHGDGVICAGGSDDRRHYTDVFRLEWKSGRVVVTPLSPLPISIANACGALMGEMLVIAGGQERPDSTEALRKVFALDLSLKAPAWGELEPIPGPGRILAAAAATKDRFWLIGGAEITRDDDGKPRRRYLTDAYCYRLGQGWSRLADLPRPSVAAPSPCPVIETGPILLGGDDGMQLGVAPEMHRGFTNWMLCHNTATNTWRDIGEIPAPRVTAPVVSWQGAWVVASGESRPGRRSPAVWTLRRD